jgi:hypothetical protein
MEKYKTLTPSARIALGVGMKFLGFQYFVYLCANIALTVATGYYLWAVEVDNVCIATNEKGNNSDDMRVNVSDRYNIILKIFFACFITEFARSLVVLIAIISKSAGVARLYEICALNECLYFAAVIILHVFRFQYSGRLCSYDQAFIDEL